jgi:hypothetical protein
MVLDDRLGHRLWLSKQDVVGSDSHMTQVACLTHERLPMMAVVVPPLPRREIICGGPNHKFHNLDRQQPNNPAMAMTLRMEKSLDTIANLIVRLRGVPTSLKQKKRCKRSMIEASDHACSGNARSRQLAGHKDRHLCHSRDISGAPSL